MIIKSSFKDYYDHIAHIYGGGDPKIVYPRHRLKERNKEYGDIDQGIFLDEELTCIKEIRGDRILMEYDFKRLILCGKQYLLVRRKDDTFKIFNKDDFPVLFKRLTYKTWWGGEVTYSDYVGNFSEELVKISRELNAPVFCIRNLSSYDWRNKKTGLLIDGDIPILANLGFPAIIPPEQMYQDISYFIANTMNGSPDIQPPGSPPLTDKERVLSHGFDVKKSFRHRI